MKGLLLREWYSLRRGALSFIVFVALFACISLFRQGDMLFVLYPGVFMGYLPVLLLTRDDKARWAEACETLPVTAGMRVAVKYLVGLAGAACIAGLTALLHIGSESPGAMAAGAFAFALVIPALALPVLFLFGSERTGVYAYAVILVGCATASFIDWETAALSARSLAGAVLVFYLLSWGIAVLTAPRRRTSPPSSGAHT